MGILRAEFFADLIREHQIETFIEVGVAKGRNIREIFEQLGGDYEIQIWCVDPYVPYEDYQHDSNANPAQIESNREQAEEGIFQDPRVEHIEKFSLEAAKRFENESLHLVHIDANHAREFVELDLRIWYPKIVPGYFICGHDYTWEERNDPDPDNFAGVIHAVDEFLEEYELELFAHNHEKTYAIRKPDE